MDPVDPWVLSTQSGSNGEWAQRGSIHPPLDPLGRTDPIQSGRCRPRECNTQAFASRHFQATLGCRTWNGGLGMRCVPPGNVGVALSSTRWAAPPFRVAGTWDAREGTKTDPCLAPRDSVPSRALFGGREGWRVDSQEHSPGPRRRVLGARAAHLRYGYPLSWMPTEKKSKGDPTTYLGRYRSPFLPALRLVCHCGSVAFPSVLLLPPSGHIGGCISGPSHARQSIRDSCCK